jgi:hypothetical protein
VRYVAIAVLLLGSIACDKPEPKPKPKVEKPPEDPIVPVDLCLVMTSEIKSINLWERPTPPDAVGVVDRGEVIGHAWAGETVRALSQTSTSYYIETEHTGKGWVSASQIAGKCPDSKTDP